jgi:hypothetical protein
MSKLRFWCLLSLLFLGALAAGGGIVALLVFAIMDWPWTEIAAASCFLGSVVIWYVCAQVRPRI